MAILWDLTIDGASVGNRVSRFSISYSQSSIHNTIEITSIDNQLYNACDPSVLSGSARIILHIGGRKLYFLLEERNGGEIDFTLWGRSLSAKYEFPYKLNIDYTLTSSKLASQVVNDMLGTTVSWGIVDWMLPTGFTFSGNCLEGASQIVKDVGGIIRCNDAGGIVVRNKWKTRPSDIDTASAIINYSNVENLLTLSAKDVNGTRENTVTVNGYSSDIELPTIETEESSPIKGETVHIRVFWGTLPPSDIIDYYVSAGAISSGYVHTSSYTEAVSFIEGVANTQRPIHSLTSIDWEGKSASPVTFIQNNKELYSADLWGLATVTYTSNYHRYSLTGHDVDRLLVAMQLDTGSNVAITVSLNVGSFNQATPISAGLLTTQNAVKSRGVAYLDDHYYDTRVIIISAPYNENAIDGIVVNAIDDYVNVAGHYYANSCGISFDGAKVLNTLEIVRPK